MNVNEGRGSVRRMNALGEKNSTENPALQALLGAREERWQQRLALSRQGTLLTLTLNLPGPDKLLPRWLAFHSRFRDDLIHTMTHALADWGEFSHVLSRRGPAGPEDHFLFPLSGDPKQIKRAAVDFEEGHPAGRLADLDVMVFGEPVGRDLLNLPLRRCLCCSRPAKECAVLSRHPLNEVLEAAGRLLDSFENPPQETQETR